MGFRVVWFEMASKAWQSLAVKLKKSNAVMATIPAETILRKTANAAISSYRVIHTAKEKTVLIKLVDGEHMSSTDSYHKHIEKEIAIRRAAKGKGLFLALLETVRVSLTTTCFVFDSPGRKSVLVEGLNMADTLLPLKFDPLDARLGGQTDPLDEPIICQRNAAVAKPIGIFKKHIIESMFDFMIDVSQWIKKQNEKISNSLSVDLCHVENMIWIPKEKSFRLLECLATSTSTSCKPIPIVDLTQSLGKRYSAVVVQVELPRGVQIGEAFGLGEDQRDEYRIMIGLSERFAPFGNACNEIDLKKWKQAHENDPRVGGGHTAKSERIMRSVLMQRLKPYRV